MPRTFRALLALSALTLAARAGGASPGAAPRSAPAPREGALLPFRAVERTLPNGLAVIVIPTGFPELVSLHVAVQTGSRNEVEPGRSGFAHFFEHMMFRGTKAYPPERYQAVVTRIGARQNAYTAEDLTSFHTTFAKQDLGEVLELEADRFMNLDYPIAAFKTESRAILGEYDKSSSNPLVKLEEAQRDAAFRVHPYEHTTMGFLADIEDMPNQYEYSRLFYARWYRPERTTLVVAGDVVPGEVLPLVERTFGRWRGAGVDRPVEIPREPPPAGPVYAHVPWRTPTLPWVTVAFHGPAFSETGKDWAAIDLLYELTFGETSELYRRLVVEEQVVDLLTVESGPNVDPALHTVAARVKKPGDALRVRDELLRAFAALRTAPPDGRRLADEKAHARNAFLRSLDSTDAIAEAVARYSVFRRSHRTLEALHRTRAALTAQDLLSAARTWFTDERLVVTTLSSEPLPAGMDELPALAAAVASPGPARDGGAGEVPRADVPVVTVPSRLPVVTVKLLFEAGSARDPAGKEGLAAIAADMIAEGGSRSRRIDEIREALHPLAASFEAQVDRELVTLTGTFPREAFGRFAEVALPQLWDPGFRDEDLRRIRDEHLGALVQDLRESNDEELGKERLQANVFAGTPYRHPTLGTVAGIGAVSMEDVRSFVRALYTRANVVVGVAGDAPDEVAAGIRAALDRLPAGAAPPRTQVVGRRPDGIEVEIVEKDTRGAAISLGHPLEVVRGHPDFVALWLAKTWLGEHRSSTSHLYQVMREARGMNYGDYAYVEAFPRGMFQLFPDPNLGRRAQLFEIWIRPVLPQNAQMALRIAVHELRRLVSEGLGEEEFEAARQYLLKNVLLMTASQEQQLGYALDSRWYGIPEFTRYMREGLARLSREEVNAAIRRHLSGDRLSVVVVTKDARALAAALVADAPSTMTYPSERPAALLEEDRRFGAVKLGIRPEAIRVTPVAEVFAR